MGNLFRFGDPAEWALGADGIAVGSIENPCSEFGVDKAGSNGADKDAMWREPLGEGLAHRVEGCLAGAIGRTFGLAAKRTARGHVDDPSTTVLDHVAGCAIGDVGWTEQVCGECLVPRLLPVVVDHLLELMVDIDAGVVDDDVEGAETIDDCLDHLSNRFRIGDVALDRHVRSTLEGCKSFLGRIGVRKIVDGYAGATCGEGGCDCTSNAA